jgi:hypothetical protein
VCVSQETLHYRALGLHAAPGLHRATQNTRTMGHKQLFLQILEHDGRSNIPYPEAISPNRECRSSIQSLPRPRPW